MLTCPLPQTNSLKAASVVRIIPHSHRGEGELVPLKRVTRAGSPDEISFTYQADKYIYTLPDEKASVTSVLVSPLITEPTFRRLPYPSDSKPALKEAQQSKGFASEKSLEQALGTYGKNLFDIPVPTFLNLFAEHAVAPSSSSRSSASASGCSTSTGTTRSSPSSCSSSSSALSSSR